MFAKYTYAIITTNISITNSMVKSLCYIRSVRVARKIAEKTIVVVFIQPITSYNFSFIEPCLYSLKFVANVEPKIKHNNYNYDEYRKRCIDFLLKDEPRVFDKDYDLYVEKLLDWHSILQKIGGKHDSGKIG